MELEVMFGNFHIQNTGKLQLEGREMIFWTTALHVLLKIHSSPHLSCWESAITQ